MMHKTHLVPKVQTQICISVKVQFISPFLNLDITSIVELVVLWGVQVTLRAGKEGIYCDSTGPKA